MSLRATITSERIDNRRLIRESRSIDEHESIREATVSRVQLALNVSDIDESVEFYSKLFGAPPAKVRPGYANFAIADPPLKLVLIQSDGTTGTINHLGVEVESTEEVAAAQQRFAAEGLATAVEDEVSCCFAVQDKVWVDAPDGEPWEFYTVLADAEMPAGQLREVTPGDDAMCCSAAPESAARCC
jgi:catechol 2,3-dioxygenase-like lactoylglutathione lyase family enzyme